MEEDAKQKPAINFTEIRKNPNKRKCFFGFLADFSDLNSCDSMLKEVARSCLNYNSLSTTLVLCTSKADTPRGQWCRCALAVMYLAPRTSLRLLLCH